jgi:hypothetical protein
MASIVPEELVAFAGRLADAAGAEIRPHFRVPSAVASKAGSSFRDVVTLVRRARPAMGSDGRARRQQPAPNLRLPCV